jgi:hypothetical protein
MSRRAELSPPASGCSSRRRCRKRLCGHCGPIRADDEWRKFHDNLVAYGGAVALVSVTAPGAEDLPWDANVCGATITSTRGRVAAGSMRGRERLELTASARYGRLFKAAAVTADRLLRHGERRGRMPRRVAVVWSEQSRGVWHVHEGCRRRRSSSWSRQVVRFMDQAHRREAAMAWEERRAARSGTGPRTADEGLLRVGVRGPQPAAAGGSFTSPNVSSGRPVTSIGTLPAT